MKKIAIVAQANSRLDENGRFLDDEVVCRFRGNNTVMAKEKWTTWTYLLNKFQFRGMYSFP